MKKLTIQFNKPLIGSINVSLDKQMSVHDNLPLQTEIQDKLREVLLKTIEEQRLQSEIDTLNKKEFLGRLKLACRQFYKNHLQYFQRIRQV
ncbi:MAG: hypothetical protein ACK50L_09105 [Bacteroidota bacterium]